MKRIVRLTESDLARIVRRVINEQNEVANSILSQMETLCNNGKAESEAMKQTVYKIKDKATYDAILKQVQSSPEFKSRQGNNYSKICDWLMAEGMDSYSTSQGSSGNPVSIGKNVVQGIRRLGSGQSAIGIGSEVERHLSQFNMLETASVSL
jgi:hypothetical protein